MWSKYLQWDTVSFYSVNIFSKTTVCAYCIFFSSSTSLIYQLCIQVSITSDMTISGPFIFLSSSYSESTNTICLLSPWSRSFLLASTINEFILRPAPVLQRLSPETQLPLQPSKSPCPPLRCPSLYTLVFAATGTQYYVFLLVFNKSTLGR